MTKSALDAFRRSLETLILSGAYTPRCTPGEWWTLWAQIEQDLVRQ